MKVEEFIKELGENPQEFEWQEGKYEGKDGIFVKNIIYDTETHLTKEIIEKHDSWYLKNATHHGKNIEQITRVTGFFSKTNWNPGKMGELKQRYRVNKKEIDEDFF